MGQRGDSARSAFTLLELLVVLAILGVLIGLLLPAVQAVREAAARAGCWSNLRQLALAAHQHEATFGSLPSGCKYVGPPNYTTTPEVASLSWLTLLLPYVEQEPLYKAAMQAHRDDPSANDSAHTAVALTVVPVFLCPAEGRRLSDPEQGDKWALKTYTGVAGTGFRADDGIFHFDLDLRLTDISDGTSSTVMIGERPPGPRGYGGAWYGMSGACVCAANQVHAASGYEPPPGNARNCVPVYSAFAPGRIDNDCDLSHFWGQHRRGANFAFADGSVRFLAYEAAPLMPALATRAGGEALPPF